MSVLSQESFQSYCKDLKALCDFPSVYSNPQDVQKVISYCREIFTRNLPRSHIVQDEAGNLIAVPYQIHSSQPILYLSAHADTVDAIPEEWSSPYRPFSAYEDEWDIVARGASDCKAGVALQLLISHLSALGAFRLSNVIFTISFKEEGPGDRSAISIGNKMGAQYPLSGGLDSLFVLENTVLIQPPTPPTLGYYTAERGNFAVEIKGHLSQLKNHLVHLSSWNPISIRPCIPTQFHAERTWTQEGGHICTLERDVNLLTAVLFSAEENWIIEAGNPKSISVAPTQIRMGRVEDPAVHSLVLGNRSFETQAEIKRQLAQISYLPLKDFALASGMQSQEAFQNSSIAPHFRALHGKYLILEETFNPGSSDASVILNSMAPRYRSQLLPIVVGPGTRSQKLLRPPRLTHGANETFNKASGRSAISTILELFYRMGHLVPKV